MGGGRGEGVEVNDPFVTIDLHGLLQAEAKKAIDRALSSAGPGVYQIRAIHGSHRGTSLRNNTAYMTAESKRSGSHDSQTVPTNHYNTDFFFDDQLCLPAD